MGSAAMAATWGVQVWRQCADIWLYCLRLSHHGWFGFPSWHAAENLAGFDLLLICAFCAELDTVSTFVLCVFAV